MKFFNKLFQKSQNIKSSGSNIVDLEIGKRTGPFNMSDMDVFWSPTSIHNALNIYDQCSPVSNSVGTIVTEFASIPPRIFDTKKKEFVEDHPMLDLLKNPNPFSSTTSFLTDISTDFLITGNAFYEATGKVSEPPLELFTNLSNAVLIVASSSFSVDEYLVSDFDRSERFKLSRTINFVSARETIRLGEFRYYNKTKDPTRELFHTKRSNRSGGSRSNRFFGRSKLTSLNFETKLSNESNIYNLSDIKRGGRPSGAFTTTDEITDDQREAIQKELNDTVGGAPNASRILLLEGDVKWVELSTKNKDMDFSKLKMSTAVAIYNEYKIPLPLVVPEQMTLANMASATLNLYDNAVLPLAKKIYDDLTKFILARYPDSENLIITFDPFDIGALEERRIDNVSKIAKVGIFSTNELRTRLGKEAAENGDDILMPANLLPLISDTFTSDNLGKPRPSSSRSKVVDLLKKQKNEKGEPFFSSEQIQKLVSDVYGERI